MVVEVKYEVVVVGLVNVVEYGVIKVEVEVEGVLVEWEVVECEVVVEVECEMVVVGLVDVVEYGVIEV